VHQQQQKRHSAAVFQRRDRGNQRVLDHAGLVPRHVLRYCSGMLPCRAPDAMKRLLCITVVILDCADASCSIGGQCCSPQPLLSLVQLPQVVS
jgi:hypothetical protein